MHTGRWSAIGGSVGAASSAAAASPPSRCRPKPGRRVWDWVRTHKLRTALILLGLFVVDRGRHDPLAWPSRT